MLMCPVVHLQAVMNTLLLWQPVDYKQAHYTLWQLCGSVDQKQACTLYIVGAIIGEEGICLVADVSRRQPWEPSRHCDGIMMEGEERRKKKRNCNKNRC